MVDRLHATKPAATNQDEKNLFWRYNLLNDAAKLGLFEADNQGNIIYVNTNMARMAGVVPAAVYGQSWLDLISPADRAEVCTAWGTCHRRGDPLSVEFLLTSNRTVRACITPVDEDTVIGTLQDITADKRLLAAVMELKQEG